MGVCTFCPEFKEEAGHPSTGVIKWTWEITCPLTTFLPFPFPPTPSHASFFIFPSIILDPGAYDACLQLPPCFEAPFSKVSGVRVPPSCWNWWRLVMPSWQQVWRLIGLCVSPLGPDSRRDLSGEWITPGGQCRVFFPSPFVLREIKPPERTRRFGVTHTVYIDGGPAHPRHGSDYHPDLPMSQIQPQRKFQVHQRTSLRLSVLDGLNWRV